MTEVRDFGILPISAIAKYWFAKIEEEVLLPPVPKPLWANHRYIPILAAALPPVDVPRDDRALAQAVSVFIMGLAMGQQSTVLYSGIAPEITLSGDILTTFLNWPEGAPSLTNMSINLSRLFWAVQRVS